MLPLPDEVLLPILKFLPFSTLAVARRLCRQTHTLCLQHAKELARKACKLTIRRSSDSSYKLTICIERSENAPQRDEGRFWITSPTGMGIGFFSSFYMYDAIIDVPKINLADLPWLLNSSWIFSLLECSLITLPMKYKDLNATISSLPRESESLHLKVSDCDVIERDFFEIEHIQHLRSLHIECWQARMELSDEKLLQQRWLDFSFNGLSTITFEGINAFLQQWVRGERDIDVLSLSFVSPGRDSETQLFDGIPFDDEPTNFASEHRLVRPGDNTKLLANVSGTGISLGRIEPFE